MQRSGALLKMAMSVGVLSERRGSGVKVKGEGAARQKLSV
jgi:hypothetical protein